MTISEQEVFNKIKSILVEQFEINGEDITREARLYEDLDIDSIDAVDLIVEMKGIIGKKIDPEIFKKVRTIDDVVKAILQTINT